MVLTTSKACVLKVLQLNDFHQLKGCFWIPQLLVHHTGEIFVLCFGSKCHDWQLHGRRELDLLCQFAFRKADREAARAFCSIRYLLAAISDQLFCTCVLCNRLQISDHSNSATNRSAVLFWLFGNAVALPVIALLSFLNASTDIHKEASRISVEKCGFSSYADRAWGVGRMCSPWKDFQKEKKKTVGSWDQFKHLKKYTVASEKKRIWFGEKVKVRWHRRVDIKWNLISLPPSLITPQLNAMLCFYVDCLEKYKRLK